MWKNRKLIVEKQQWKQSRVWVWSFEICPKMGWAKKSESSKHRRPPVEWPLQMVPVCPKINYCNEFVKSSILTVKQFAIAVSNQMRDLWKLPWNFTLFSNQPTRVAKNGRVTLLIGQFQRRVKCYSEFFERIGSKNCSCFKPTTSHQTKI